MSKLQNYVEILKKINESHVNSIKAALIYLNHKELLSLRDIGKLIERTHTYVQRLYKKYKIPLLNKSDIIKAKYKSGEINPVHKPLTQEQKDCISKNMAQNWKDNPNRGDKNKQRLKELNEKMTDSEKSERSKKMLDGVRKAAEHGSKLENIIVEGIKNAGFVSTRHKVGVLSNSDLEFDIYIPEIGVIIEVDGPSHFLPIWGEKRLQQNKKRDLEKSGTATNMGFNFIRVIQSKKTISQIYKKEIIEKVINCLEKIRSNRLTSYYEEII